MKLSALQRLTYPLAHRRWWFGLAGYCLALGALCVFAVFPVLKIEMSSILQFSKDRRLQKDSSQYSSRIIAAKEQVRAMDSLLLAINSRASYDQTALMGSLYGIADSTGCKVDKVEVGERIVADSNAENPFVIKGAGQYSGVGRIVDGIENQPCATRVRQIVLGNKGAGSVDFLIDFVVME